MRYPIQAAVTVRNSSGAIRASAANISASGMLLRVGQPTAFRIGEEVAVEVELPDNPGKPFSAWGLARVVRIEDGGFGSNYLPVLSIPGAIPPRNHEISASYGVLCRIPEIHRVGNRRSRR
jgi:hypothetical protein